MRRSPITRLGLVLVAALVGLQITSAATAQAAPAPGPRKAVTRTAERPAPARAVWVWTQPSADELVQWARDHRVGTLFMQVPAGLPSSTSLPWATSVSRLAHASGLKVAALNGDPGWLQRPTSARDWMRAALGTGLFDGVHVDVEPWALPGWQTAGTRVTLTKQYLTLLRTLSRATTLPVEADVSYSLNLWRAPGGGPLDRAVMRSVDAVTVMTYRNRTSGPDGVLGVGATALRSAAVTGTPCRLAVETLYYGDTAVDRKQTFDGLGQAVLAQTLDEVDALASSAPEYAGMAVHHYDSWRTLTP